MTSRLADGGRAPRQGGGLTEPRGKARSIHRIGTAASFPQSNGHLEENKNSCLFGSSGT